ncbi:MAG: STAS domain-containing protein [Candidatus Nitronauta litoralis]|uniref:Anti-sigma factor antagonist n=1 Tax=Candidatus Nitronauta litoralis TaxID=2705533 RepID=A0A7T0BU19_9BACT|nr:MAG: STAS domain-containing protein [Candidatus Nitronauta litoralis]
MEKIHKEILGMMGKIDIDCRDEAGVVIIDLKGQMDVYNSGELQRLVDAYIARGLCRFVVNLEKVTYMDSSTISVFLHSLQKVQKLEGRFFLASITGAPKEVFDMAKLHEVFNVYDDVADAIDAHDS